MAVIVELNGVRPTVGQDVYLAPTAVLIGAVEVGDRASIWFGAVLRADSAEIRVGAGTSVQDNAVLHCAKNLPTVIGADVIIGHGALLEGCVVEDGAIVGMGAIVLQRSRLGSRAMLAAGSVLVEGGAIPPEVLAAGAPAVVKKPLSGSAAAWSEGAAAAYQRYRERYLAHSRLTEVDEFETMG